AEYMGAMNSSQIEIKCLANGMGPYMECIPTFVWNKCGSSLDENIPVFDGHSSACAWIKVYILNCEVVLTVI
ncbi:hypothetical protein AAEH90_13980, partial [Shewanella algae]